TTTSNPAFRKACRWGSCTGAFSYASRCAEDAEAAGSTPAGPLSASDTHTFTRSGRSARAGAKTVARSAVKARKRREKRRVAIGLKLLFQDEVLTVTATIQDIRS